jgi:predicted molibdopterin-dependent oxidoreductase YjgC
MANEGELAVQTILREKEIPHICFHPSEIMDELASVSPLYAGVSYQRLEGYNNVAMSRVLVKMRAAAWRLP